VVCQIRSWGRLICPLTSEGIRPALDLGCAVLPCAGMICDVPGCLLWAADASMRGVIFVRRFMSCTVNPGCYANWMLAWCVQWVLLENYWIGQCRHCPIEASAILC
jgi:hypothetical protein